MYRNKIRKDMSIRLTSGCVNCQNLTEERNCAIHNVKVEERFTCDSFDMRPSLFDEVDCTSCSRMNDSSCAHPAKASAGMMCSKYAPNANA